MARPLCRHASPLIRKQEEGGRLRRCALQLYETVEQFGVCQTCDKWAARVASTPAVATDTPTKDCNCGCAKCAEQES